MLHLFGGYFKYVAECNTLKLSGGKRWIKINFIEISANLIVSQPVFKVRTKVIRREVSSFETQPATRTLLG